MSERFDFYKCSLCGTIIQVFHRGDGELVCCGKPMEYLQPHKQEEEKKEKHVPVKINNKIQVGSELHPMTEEHHIEFIEIISEDKKELSVKFLDNNDIPQMNLNSFEPKHAIEYCNLHGLWENKDL